MLRITLAGGLCATLLLAAWAADEAPDAPADAPPKLELKVTAKEVPYGTAFRVVFNAELKNVGDQPVTLVQPGDGSTHGWRTPIISWAKEGKWPAPGSHTPRCGNINPLTADEVVDVAPGKSLKMGDWVGSDLATTLMPGRHTVTLRYQHDPKLTWKGLPLGEHDAKAMQRIRDSRAVSVDSAPLVVNIDENGRLRE